MSNFATKNDVISLFRPLTADEGTRVEALIPIVCDMLRIEAEKVGKNLDFMVQDSDIYANVVKEVVVACVGRVLNTSTTNEPMSQFTESGLGYSFTGTYSSPGGGIYLLRKELSRLGLRRQKMGVIDFC